MNNDEKGQIQNAGHAKGQITQFLQQINGMKEKRSLLQNKRNLIDIQPSAVQIFIQNLLSHPKKNTKKPIINRHLGDNQGYLNIAWVSNYIKEWV